MSSSEQNIIYDRTAMIKRTLKEPVWLHFGVGNIFRGYIAGIADRLIKAGHTDRGIIAAETFDDEIVTKEMRPDDNIVIGAVLKANGEIERQTIGSIAESFTMAEFDRIAACFCEPSLQMVTMTITEKGYRLFSDGKTYLPAVLADIKAGPDKAQTSLIGILTALCYRRYLSGQYPVALLSLDNCSRNGELLNCAVLGFAKEWVASGKVKKGFLDYLKDDKKVSFPWSMIDRITPAPSNQVARILDFKDSDIIKTSKNTFVAPFVNMEEFCCLVVEDSFPNGRPPLEKAGVMLCDRQTVEKCESMKVYTCLNPLHTALAVLGCLLGFTKISDEMEDRDLSEFIIKLGYGEMLPVAVDPSVLSAKDFLDAVVKERLPNPFIPDTPQRIATDTSQKMPVRYGNAVIAHKRRQTVDGLKAIPFVIAAWCRYLTGIDDAGNAFVQSPDPGLSVLKPIFSALQFGADHNACREAVDNISSAQYYVEELPEVLKQKAADYLYCMMSGAGAVRRTLHQIVSDK